MITRLENNQSPRQTIHNVKVLLMCARAVRGLFVGSCLMHVCAHYTLHANHYCTNGSSSTIKSEH